MDKELNEYEIREKENAKEVVDHLSRFVNSMGRNPKYFANAVSQEHRTLQQSMFNVFLACIEMWANLPENWYDLRNEYTVMQSRKIIKALEGHIHAPLI